MPRGRQKIIDVATYFWSRVAIRSPHECWLWKFCTDKDGYGVCNLLGETKAHRVAYVLANGPVPDGLFVLHKCPVAKKDTKCVNPGHLYAGDHTNNMQDRLRDGTYVKCFDGIRRSYKGIANPHTKLSNASVKKVRKLWSTGKYTKAVIAKQFGISSTHVSRLVANKQRTDVASAMN